MIYPHLSQINWDSLVGGDKDATASIAARDRKLSASAKLAVTILPLAEKLQARGRLFASDVAILGEEPLAARWYLDLAGLTRKLIGKLRPSYLAAGVSINPDTIASSRERHKPVHPGILEAFSSWINSVLLELYPVEKQSLGVAIATVLALMGARIDGQVRNQTGDDAVLILKTLLVGAFGARNHPIEVDAPAGGWMPFSAATDLSDRRLLRFSGRIVCEFIAGGNRPDIKISIDGIVIAQGEVKGRTDLSNLWESWMPQIHGHLQTWTMEMSMSPRLFFGTIITSEMIEGKTSGGTQHNGLRAFRNSGLLSGAYNLANIVEGKPAAVAAFDDLVDQLCATLSAGT